MRVATNRALRESCDPWRSRQQRIALVPTMGNLHAGHISLCRRAAELADRVVVTIFVNPTQFGPGEDFENYPRTLDDDVAALSEARCADVLFVPEIGEIYPNGTDHAARVTLPVLSGELCGASRPGHFEGAAGVVLRLCNIAQPHVLVLGEKDFQQLVLIKWLLSDLGLNLEVHGAPIVRDSTGLALSSRNRYLSAAQRELAPELQRTLAAVAAEIRSGARGFEEIESRAIGTLESKGFSVDYVEVRDAASLRRPQRNASSEMLIVLAAAKLGRARLIDNVRV